MNNRYLFVLSFLAFIFILTENGMALENSPEGKDTKKETIKINVDLKNERKLQYEVDKGHQPWRLKSIDVAYSVLTQRDKNVIYETCYSISETKSHSEVECRGTRKYLVKLERLIKPGGLWTAISIQIY